MNTLNKYIWSLSPLFRKLLIVLTKYVVYVLCLLLLIDYSEKLIAYYNNDFFEGMDGYAYLFTPISFSITLYVKITLIAAILLLLLAISLHFCWKYLLGVLYIFAVLIQREYLASNPQLSSSACPSDENERWCYHRYSQCQQSSRQ